MIAASALWYFEQVMAIRSSIYPIIASICTNTCIIYGNSLLRLQLQTTQESFSHRLDTTEAKLRAAEADHGMDLDTALIKLEEEQQRLVVGFLPGLNYCY